MTYCTSHLERTGQHVEAYKLGLCEDCFQGKPINERVEMSGGAAYHLLPVDSGRENSQ